MGFGRKTDFQTGRVLDLDKSYNYIIKPAAEAAGLRCLRADEIVHSGVIDVPMYQQLIEADVVIADLSTLNPNALYELGVRHALRPFTTISIAEKHLIYPFDMNHTMLRSYDHLGDGIDYEEVMRFRGELTRAIGGVLERPQPDSPVYTYLHGLSPPQMNAADQTVSEETAEVSGQKTLRLLLQQADDAIGGNDFDTAKVLLKAARELSGNDPYVTQRLALATYKAESPTPEAALREATAILAELRPDLSNDPETLGLWGSVHKRLWDLRGDRSDLDMAIRSYERGFDIRDDSYNGINLAYLLNVRATISPPAEAIADFVAAERVRRRVIVICEALLEAPMASSDQGYWIRATMAEAFLGIGDEATCSRWLEAAKAEEPAAWMLATTDRQMAGLRRLLIPSPLEMIRPVQA